ncbi:MAG TPA: hypothetical protein VJB89_02470 [Candidatus Nanoarchaeia archaeon]|nr:hypothetical protein [Candidatus Nanoarchaeia archaeon]
MKKLKQFFNEFKEGMKDFGSGISMIVNSILLIIVYLIGVGITSLIAKIFNKRFLQTKFSRKETYWEDLNLKKKNKEDYYKQF